MCTKCASVYVCVAGKWEDGGGGGGGWRGENQAGSHVFQPVRVWSVI